MDLRPAVFRRVQRPSTVGSAILACLLPFAVRAHELEATVNLVAPTVVIRAAYGGSEPVQFAKVQVFSPAAPSEEFQTAVTDRRGYFSFVPSGPGIWRVVIDDEEGHRRDVRVTIPQSFQATSTAPVEVTSRLQRVLLGIALIIGCTGFLYGFKARRFSNRSPS